MPQPGCSRAQTALSILPNLVIMHPYHLEVVRPEQQGHLTRPPGRWSVHSAAAAARRLGWVGWSSTGKAGVARRRRGSLRAGNWRCTEDRQQGRHRWGTPARGRLRHRPRAIQQLALFGTLTPAHCALAWHLSWHAGASRRWKDMLLHIEHAESPDSERGPQQSLPKAPRCTCKEAVPSPAIAEAGAGTCACRPPLSGKRRSILAAERSAWSVRRRCPGTMRKPKT